LAGRIIRLMRPAKSRQAIAPGYGALVRVPKNRGPGTTSLRVYTQAEKIAIVSEIA